MNDSRKDDRLNVALIMRYREPTMLEPREGQCQNVSLSGMCIATPKPSPRGALIRFECISGGIADGIRGTARVVWQRGKGDQRSAPCMGVRFVRLEPGCREALETLIDQLAGERPPSGSELPRAPAGGEAPAREAVSERPGQSTLLIAPGGSGGMTQQGMGAVRSRSMHYPTLRGIGLPSSAPPPRAETRGASSRPESLSVTLPGHATTSSVPFPTTPSAPPEPPGDRSPAPAGTSRDRLDRTRRGMPPMTTPSPSDTDPGSPPAELRADPVNVLGDTGQEWPRDTGEEWPRDATRDPSPGSGTTDGWPYPHAPTGSDAPGDKPLPEYPGLEAATAEPVDDVSPAGARALRLSPASAVAELPAPDGARKRNLVPWIVVGSGLLVSFLMVRLFGSAPAGVPVSAAIEDAPEQQQARTTAAASTASTAVAPLPPPQTSAAARSGGYVLEVASEPAGARIRAADQVMLAPATLQLPAVNGPLSVEAELDGYEKASVTVQPGDFTLRDGQRVAKVTVKLPPAPRERPSKQTPARPERSRSRDEKSEDSARDARRARDREAGASAAATAVPQVATPPVPIETGAERSPPAPPEPPDLPEPSSAAATSSGEAPAAAESTAEGQSDALETALACLSRGDNLCVVKTLEGRARTARELAVLIETHLALGNAPDAERNMRKYLERFPDGKNAAKYERWLERRGAAAQP